MERADIALVNTCAFIEDAKRESIDAILDLIEMKKEGRLKKIIVYGCLAQRYKDDLRKEMPQIDAFLGRVSLNHEVNRFVITPRHYAYLKICEGCINNCSFCSIPQIKGRFSSLDLDSVLKKVDSLNKDKISELNIIGQDISGYGLDLYGIPRLVEVIEKISERSKNIGWIRLLYLYPERINDDLLKLIRDLPRVCKYMDLPIQHINDRILKLMNRKTKKIEILRLIERIRKYIPPVALRTSIIIGFPSETEREFAELLKFVEDIKFERLGAFTYSREEGTPAYNFKTQVPAKLKIERLNRIMSCQQDISRKINKKFLSRTMVVLIDEKDKDIYLGRSQYDAPEVDGLVYVKSKKQLKAGDFVKVKITDTLEYDLVGEVE
jgi:ribosomal protein S12 methylthiotransferase